jgi:hypothetical protein
VKADEAEMGPMAGLSGKDVRLVESRPHLNSAVRTIECALRGERARRNC